MKAEGKINDSMDVATKVEILKTEYAKRNVASYFQRYEPSGYEDVMGALKRGDLVARLVLYTLLKIVDSPEYIRLNELLKKESQILDNKEALIEKYPALEYMEIVPDYTWTEDFSNEETTNNQFIPSGYYAKPKVSTYADKEFFDRYGINLEEWLKNPTMDLTEMTPTKNQEEYRLLTLLVDTRKKVIENYGEEGNINEFQAVQLTGTRFENFARLSNWGNVSRMKDGVKDFFQSRGDEKLYGELIDDKEMSKLGSTIDAKIIPKYFQNQVEDPGMLTDNTVAAALIDLKQSILYKERGNSERTLKALEYKVAHQSF